MHSKIDYTSPNVEFTYNLNDNTLFERDSNNFINELSIDQLNTLKNVSILDIYLSKGKIVEPHYHQDSTELIYCIAGGVTVSLLNPFTKKLRSYSISPGEVVNVPQGWWHYIVSDEEESHFLGIFNAPKPQVILGSDLLSLTPANIIADTYCVDEAKWKEVTEPIPSSVFIGPPRNCQQEQESVSPSHSTLPVDQWNPYSYCRPY